MIGTLDPVMEAPNSQADLPPNNPAEAQVEDEQAAMNLSLFAQLASHAAPLPVGIKASRLSFSSSSPSVSSASASAPSSPNGGTVLMSMARRQSTSAIDSLLSRRHVHNVCERKRRDHIRNGFQLLHDRLPARDERLSKMEILRAALEHVRWLKGEVARLEAQ